MKAAYGFLASDKPKGKGLEVCLFFMSLKWSLNCKKSVQKLAHMTIIHLVPERLLYKIEI